MQSRQRVDSTAPFMRAQGIGGKALDSRSAGWVVWGSITVVFMLTLLPWRLMEAAPDLLMLTLAFWAVHESKRVGMLTAFVLGLLVDVHDSGPLGQYALTYVLACYGGIMLHRRLLRFDLWRQAMHMVLVFLVARAVTVVIAAWVSGAWPGWWWVIGVLIASALWVPVGWLFLLPGQRLDDVNADVS
ncbi:rod shape-determining protein MreD [Orrella sp. 11846]|uniref:rod shape-determining protein MreD n=1 Tax=Orrella sp. 11846 TaxID=3409913 RepID=UPI003B5B5D3C